MEAYIKGCNFVFGIKNGEAQAISWFLVFINIYFLIRGPVNRIYDRIIYFNQLKRQ